MPSHTKKAILLFLTTWALLVLLLLVFCEGNWLFFVLRWKSALEVATIGVQFGIRFGSISFFPKAKQVKTSQSEWYEERRRAFVAFAALRR